MSWLESIILGLVAGVTEFLPVSSQAHEVIISGLLGVDSMPAFSRMLNHMAMVLALYTCCHDSLRSLYAEMELNQQPKSRRSREPIRRSIFDVAFIQTAFYPLAIGFFCYPYTSRILDDLQWMAFFLALNGIVLFVPQYIRRGNKDSLSMTRFDSIFFGLASGLGVVPGISRIAAGTALGSIRGGDRQHTLRWALLLSIPALAFMLGFDIRDIILEGINLGGILGIVKSLVGALFAYLGANLGIQVMRFLSVNTGYSGFSYYCWGAALFSFVLYLL